MKSLSILFGLAICTAGFLGCSRGSPAVGSNTNQGTIAQQQSLPPDKRATLGNPSMDNTLDQLPPKERAAKIREFKAKGLNKSFLKSQLGKYVNDPDADVAQAAKEAVE